MKRGRPTQPKASAPETRTAIQDSKYSHRVTCSVCEASVTKDFFDQHICAIKSAAPQPAKAAQKGDDQVEEVKDALLQATCKELERVNQLRIEETTHLSQQINKLERQRDGLLEALKSTTNALKDARTFILLDDKGKAVYDETGALQASAQAAIADVERRAS